MKNSFEIMAFAEKICSFAPRLGKKEQLTAAYIKGVLREQEVEFFSQGFQAAIPLWGKAELKADGEKINCKNTSLISGKILGKDNLISSFPYLDEAKTSYNINFSPYADAICTVGFYHHPSVAIKFSDLQKIFQAKKVTGAVKVSKYSYTSENILVGNRKNPQFLVFTHYDCLGNGGAVDNASGVAVAMQAVIKKPELLINTLFIFSGCEEISYDQYNPSGLGYRVFEQAYSSQLRTAKRIYILDGLGTSKPHLTQDGTLLDITLQVKTLKNIKDKCFLMQCDSQDILKVYHSDQDTFDKLGENHLIQSTALLVKDMAKASL